MAQKLRLLFSAVLPALFLFHACCWRCKETPPDVGTMRVRVSEDITDSIRIHLYRGRTPGDSAIVVDTVTSNRSYTLESGYEYAGEAIYEKNGKTVIAVDRNEITVKDRSDRDCADSVCYIPDNGTLDLQLKRDPF